MTKFTSLFFPQYFPNNTGPISLFPSTFFCHYMAMYIKTHTHTHVASLYAIEAVSSPVHPI